MAVTFVNAGAFDSDAAATSVPPIPSGCVANDIMLLYVESANQSVAAPAGWSTASVGSGGGAAGGTSAILLQCFWKRHTGSESDPTVPSAGNHQLCVILAFRGVVLSGNPWDATPVTSVNTTANTGVTFPTVTTVTDNCMVVAAVANWSVTSNPTGSYSNAGLTSITEQVDGTTAVGNGGNLAVFTAFKTTAGATGTTSAAVSGGAGKSYVVIPLKPEPAAATSVPLPTIVQQAVQRAAVR